MQVPRWNDLQDFVAIARAGQLSRAAISLGVDATTMSRRLRRLEAGLGQTLFEKTREGQVLTEAGERLLAHAEAMQRAADQIAERPSNPRELTGLLRVSVSEGFGAWFIAEHLGEFVGRFPALTIDLVASSGFLSPSKRETDIAILLARPRAGPVVSAKLADYGLRIYGSHDYARHNGMPSGREALKGHRLIGYIPDLLYAPELRYLSEVDGALGPTVRSSSILAQHRLITSGVGVGVLPCFIGDADPHLIRMVPDIRIERTFWMVTHQDTRQLQRIRVFNQWLTTLVAEQRTRLAGA
jgi:DNA-binding transcriptional LysR family regulator